MNPTVTHTTRSDSAAQTASGDRSGGPSAGRHVPAMEQTRELISSVLAATLFESGLLEKVVQRVVAETAGATAGDGSGTLADGQLASLAKKIQADCLTEIRQEVTGWVKKEVSAAMSSENMKMLIDDKFRAISIYLKTDVIPKAVAQTLKNLERKA